MWSTVLIGGAAALALIYFLFVVLGRRFAKRKIQEALAHGQRGDHKAACYAYALATLNGRDCREQIKRLWEEHGPFNYRDYKKAIEDEPETNNEQKQDKQCSLIDHGATVSIISEAVTGDKHREKEFT